MNTFQKIIKYVAIGFAIILTVGILSGLVGAVATVVTVFNGIDGEVKTMDFSEDFTDVEKLDISNKYGKLSIRPGDQFRVEATDVSDKFRAKVKDGTLIVDESDYKFLWFDFGKSINRKAYITIYVPENFNAKRIEIDSGAGEVILENLSTDALIVNAGVGKIIGWNILARSVKASGGVGDIKFTDVNFKDVEFDSGVGNIKLEGIITGDSEFDCGIGSVEIDIKANREDYNLDIDSGVGDIKVNGGKISSDYKDNYRSDHSISVNGGIGSVEINFRP